MVYNIKEDTLIKTDLKTLAFVVGFVASAVYGYIDLKNTLCSIADKQNRLIEALKETGAIPGYFAQNEKPPHYPEKPCNKVYYDYILYVANKDEE